MSDHRWTDVDADLDSAVTQLGMALRTFDRAGFDSDDPDVAWERSSAFLHGMESGYTLIERAIKRVLDILGEIGPSGEAWHKDRIDRVSRSMRGETADQLFSILISGRICSNSWECVIGHAMPSMTTSMRPKPDLRSKQPVAFLPVFAR